MCRPQLDQGNGYTALDGLRPVGGPVQRYHAAALPDDLRLLQASGAQPGGEIHAVND